MQRNDKEVEKQLQPRSVSDRGSRAQLASISTMQENNKPATQETIISKIYQEVKLTLEFLLGKITNKRE